MNTYHPSPALDLREWLAQQEAWLRHNGWTPLPMGALVFMAGLPAGVPADSPMLQLSDEQRLANLRDYQDIMIQQWDIVQAEIDKLEARVAVKTEPIVRQLSWSRRGFE